MGVATHRGNERSEEPKSKTEGGNRLNAGRGGRRGEAQTGQVALYKGLADRSEERIPES